MKGWNQNHINDLAAKGMLRDFTNQPNNRNIVIDNAEVFKRVRKANRHDEEDLQENIIKVFRLLYPKLRGLLYAVPNGGQRNAIEAGRLIRQGVRPGVLDLNFDYPSGKWHGMKIEVKTDKGRLSPYQIQYIKDVQENYYCCVVRSTEQFLREIKDYLECN